MNSDDCIFSHFFRTGFNILPSAPHLFSSFQRNCTNCRPCLIFRNMSTFLQWGIRRLSHIRPRRRTARLCCPWLLIRSICSYSANQRPPPPPENLGRSVSWWHYVYRLMVHVMRLSVSQAIYRGFLGWLLNSDMLGRTQHIPLGYAPRELCSIFFDRWTFIECSLIKDIIFIYQTN
jgi:hypothetical protein